MPKVIAYTLGWLDERGEYTISPASGETELAIVPESPEWFAWLKQVSSFAFAGKQGRYTLRKENRQRGDVYWYAYASGGKQLVKRYAGRTHDLTLARLEELGEALTAQRAQDQAPAEPGQAFSLPATPAEQASPLHAGESVATRSTGSGQGESASIQTRGDLLLATKLRAPRPRTQGVARERLFTQLEQGIEGALTLISAPVGFGKTTLLARWLAERERPAAWLSLEAEDNPPARFFTYLIAALQTLDPAIGAASLPPLRAHQPPALEGILALLSNEIAASRVDPLLLVLDDYHVISNEAIHRALLFLLEHLASQLRLVMLTRSDPLLPLARLRARGQLTELRASDLRFDLAESGQFLQEVMHISLPAADLSLLEQRTEGWVAGLQLAALSLRGKQDISAFLRAFSGSNRFVLDYLGDEVLAHQPEHILTFLLHTCLLERLSASLCSALLDDARYTPDACQAMLEQLEKMNLFVNPLDDEQRWYRYHQLFAAVLQARLAQNSPELIPVLHLRASHWFEEHGYIHEAVHHTLEIQDATRLAALLQPVVWDLMAEGELAVLTGWLQRLPDEKETMQPLLCLYHAAALSFPGQALAADRYLRYAEEAMQAGQQIPVGEIAAVRATIEMTRGNLEQAAAAAELARTSLSEEQGFLRTLVAGLQAFIYAISGDFRAAIQCLVEASAIPHRIENAFTVQRALTSFSFFLYHLGQLSQAIATCQGLFQRSLRPGARTLPYSGFMCVVLATCFYEKNEIAEAEKTARQAIEFCQQLGEYQFLSDAYALLAQILYLAQLRAGAGSAPAPEVRELARRAEELLWKEPLTMLWAKNTTAYYLVRLWIMQGDTEAIARLERFYPIDERACSAPGVSYAIQTDARGLAYIRFGQHRPQSIEGLLRWPIEDAEQNGRVTSLVRMCVLQSVAYAQLNRLDDALAALKRAVQVGEPERYINAFVEQGQQMQELLQTLFTHEQARPIASISLPYVRTLLRAFGPENEPAPIVVPPVPALLEALTEREMDVLRLMGQGLSNAEIARRMVVEVSTVKWHVHHIYDKLQVSSRAQALLRAQELHLLT